MLKEAKKWVQTLEETLTKLAQEFNRSIEELDDAFAEWYDNGGSDFDLGGPMSSPEAFASEYRADRKEEAESEAYDEVYKKMRAFAADRGYDLEDGEIESIIEEAEEDGDSVLDCADGALRELVEDWVADHQV
jgi:hypothetical protein